MKVHGKLLWKNFYNEMCMIQCVIFLRVFRLNYALNFIASQKDKFHYMVIPIPYLWSTCSEKNQKKSEKKTTL